MTTRIRVAQFGLGPIGIESLRLAARRPGLEIVGGVDIDPDKVGKSLTEVTGIAGLDNCRVFESFGELWQAAAPQVVLHTAGSRAEQSIRQIEPMARHGVSVISSCEELLFPRLRVPEATERLDAICRDHGARVLGTGVNPGFVLDLLPVCLTGACCSVESVYGERVVNASTRRRPLQQKIGSGLEPDEFRRLFAAGRAGHAGFRESAAILAHGLGWKLDDVTESCEPVVAERTIRTEYFEVPAGRTCGLHQRVEGQVGGKTRLVLDLKMYLDAPDPHDMIRIEGDPPVEFVAPGGIAGDQATVAALVNAIPRVLVAPAGVVLMTDLAVPACR